MYTISIWLFQELTGYSENNDQYFETAETAASLRRFDTHYNAKYVFNTCRVPAVCIFSFYTFYSAHFRLVYARTSPFLVPSIARLLKEKLVHTAGPVFRMQITERSCQQQEQR